MPRTPKPRVYKWSQAIDTTQPLVVHKIPADQWGRLLKAYPELEPAMSYLAGTEDFTIHPPVAARAEVLEILRTSQAGKKEEERDRRIITSRHRGVVVAVTQIIYDQKHGGIDVYIHRLARGTQVIEAHTPAGWTDPATQRNRRRR